MAVVKDEKVNKEQEAKEAKNLAILKIKAEIFDLMELQDKTQTQFNQIVQAKTNKMKELDALRKLK